MAHRRPGRNCRRGARRGAAIIADHAVCSFSGVCLCEIVTAITRLAGSPPGVRSVDRQLAPLRLYQSIGEAGRHSIHGGRVWNIAVVGRAAWRADCAGCGFDRLRGLHCIPAFAAAIVDEQITGTRACRLMPRLPDRNLRLGATIPFDLLTAANTSCLLPTVR